jgi:uncharacterized LabA/DUF88 family protein
MSLDHLKDEHVPGGRRELYRIFFYDCPPLMKKAHQPISKSAIDFSKTPVAIFRLGLHDELRKLRKCALRLGHLGGDAQWAMKEGVLEQLLKGERSFGELTDQDFTYAASQKGVDMRIGLDIASMAYKRQVDQIVLVAGDSDFVPAAKLARREGIDFILDPMWKPIHAELFEHIDGLRSTTPNPNKYPHSSGTK